MKSRKLFKVCALLMLAVMSCLLFSGCGGQSEQKKFVITYLPNESTDKNADASGRFEQGFGNGGHRAGI